MLVHDNVMLTCKSFMLTCIYKLKYDYLYIPNDDIHINE